MIIYSCFFSLDGICFDITEIFDRYIQHCIAIYLCIYIYVYWYHNPLVYSYDSYAMMIISYMSKSSPSSLYMYIHAPSGELTNIHIQSHCNHLCISKFQRCIDDYNNYISKRYTPICILYTYLYIIIYVYIDTFYIMYCDTLQCIHIYI